MKLLGSVKTRADFVKFYQNAKWPVNAGCVVPPDTKFKQMLPLRCYWGPGNARGFPCILDFMLDMFCVRDRGKLSHRVYNSLNVVFSVFKTPHCKAIVGKGQLVSFKSHD